MRDTTTIITKLIVLNIWSGLLLNYWPQPRKKWFTSCLQSVSTFLWAFPATRAWSIAFSFFYLFLRHLSSIGISQKSSALQIFHLQYKYLSESGFHLVCSKHMCVSRYYCVSFWWAWETIGRRYNCTLLLRHSLFRYAALEKLGNSASVVH